MKIKWVLIAMAACLVAWFLTSVDFSRQAEMVKAEVGAAQGFQFNWLWAVIALIVGFILFMVLTSRNKKLREFRLRYRKYIVITFLFGLFYSVAHYAWSDPVQEWTEVAPRTMQVLWACVAISLYFCTVRDNWPKVVFPLVTFITFLICANSMNQAPGMKRLDMPFEHVAQNSNEGYLIEYWPSDPGFPSLPIEIGKGDIVAFAVYGDQYRLESDFDWVGPEGYRNKPVKKMWFPDEFRVQDDDFGSMIAGLDERHYFSVGRGGVFEARAYSAHLNTGVNERRGPDTNWADNDTEYGLPVLIEVWVLRNPPKNLQQYQPGQRGMAVPVQLTARSSRPSRPSCSGGSCSSVTS